MKETLENSLKRPVISWTKKGGNPAFKNFKLCMSFLGLKMS
jgi:hypothetical protein